MRLNMNIEAVDFITAVRNCRNDVFFQTPEGDSLNLKSLLSQYIFACILENPEFIESGKIVCTSDEDIQTLQAYLAE